MLTDETIRKIFEDEKNSPGLTPLPDNFFDEVKDYLEKKSGLSRDESDQWTIDSIKRRLKAIFACRERKILNAVHGFIDSGVLPDNMAPEEEKFFERAVDCVKGFHRQREGSFETAEEEPLVLLTILEDIRRFVGINMKNYGPYKKGDITTMPEPNANLLIEKQLAEKTEIKN